MRCSQLFLLGCSLLAMTAWAEDHAARRKRLEKMTAVEKDELARKKERFDKLTEDQQRSLRSLDQVLASAPDGSQLQDVLLHYHEWLRALPSKDRLELLSLPADQRVDRIKQLMDKQEQERLKDLAREALTESDLEVVRSWFTDLRTRAVTRILAELPADQRQALEKISDSRERTKRVFEAHGGKGFDWQTTKFEELLQISEKDRDELIQRLSEKARNTVQKSATDEDRRKLIFSWVGVASFQRFRPRLPSPEELQATLERLDRKERDRIESMPRDEMRNELGKHYFRERFGKGRPPFSPDGFTKGRPPFSAKPPREVDSKIVDGNKYEPSPK